MVKGGRGSCPLHLSYTIISNWCSQHFWPRHPRLARRSRRPLQHNDHNDHSFNCSRSGPLDPRPLSCLHHHLFRSLRLHLWNLCLHGARSHRPDLQGTRNWREDWHQFLYNFCRRADGEPDRWGAGYHGQWGVFVHATFLWSNYGCWGKLDCGVEVCAGGVDLEKGLKRLPGLFIGLLVWTSLLDQQSSICKRAYLSVFLSRSNLRPNFSLRHAT